jgi:hypothetical protein
MASAKSVLQRPIPELFEEDLSADAKHSSIDIPEDVIRQIRVQLVVHSEFEQIWSSHSSSSATNVTVWRPQIGSSSFLSKNRARLYLGDYACQGGLRSPAEDVGGGRVTIELHDTTSTGITSSKLLPAVVAQFCPAPLRFKQVWYKRLDKGSPSLYVWRAVPPSQKFVALGMVATTTDDPPPVADSMRCVPRAWCTESLEGAVAPTMIWEDSGTGGRPGSIWALPSGGELVLDSGRGTLDTLVATPGHRAPFDCVSFVGSNFT